jgi:acyl-CoA thioesterase-1
MSGLKVIGIIFGIIGVVAVILLFVKRPDNMPVTASANSEGITYLPLGDSYTIGQSVAAADRWPNQLVERFKAKNQSIQIVDNPAVTGFTTQDLIDQELPLLQKYKPQFVTVQIGVNDYVQGVPTETFQKNLEYIISAVQTSVGRSGSVLLVTIPDYGKTPTGAQYGNPDDSHKAILAFNDLISQAGKAHNIPVADVFSASEGVSTDASLIAKDGLHPSGKQYKLWTDVIEQVMIQNSLPRTFTPAIK